MNLQQSYGILLCTRLIIYLQVNCSTLSKCRSWLLILYTSGRSVAFKRVLVWLIIQFLRDSVYS